MSRIADLVHHQQTLSKVIDGLTRLRETQTQIASGKVAHNYAGIAKDTGRLLSFEAQRAQALQFVDNNKQAQQRLEAMDLAVDGMFSAVSDLRRLLVQATSDNSGDPSFLVAQAEQLLAVVGQQLSADLNGRFLFSGSLTQTAPVTIPVPDPATTGVPDATYYNGDGLALAVRADDQVTLSYGITADRIGFQQAIGAMKAAIAGAQAGTRLVLDAAIELADAALTELSSYRAEIGTNLKTLDDINTRHEDFALYAEGLISDIENVDVPAAISRIAQDQILIEASFAMLARIGQLSLTNYLR